VKLVIFGLSVSSSWGNGHATLWRGLCRALAKRGHDVIFFERDTPYYAQHRDLHELPGGTLILYPSWDEIRPIATRHLQDADVAIVTSYCPDAIAATDLALDSPAALRVFYDLDAPVTLARLAAGETVDYIPPRGLRDFDLTLSYSGGRSLDQLREVLGARRTAALYGSVDPDVHRPAQPDPNFQAELGYLGTYAADRNELLEKLFVEPARRRPMSRFLLAGSKYDAAFPWEPNIYYMSHLPPAQHSAFYCSTRLTLNVTRQAMRDAGYCPSGRLFEAAASGAAVLSDSWEGLDHFFEPDAEILVANGTEQALAALDRSPEELARIARAARERTLAEHTSMARAIELEAILDEALASPAGMASVEMAPLQTGEAA
jgi:spore maturation protein CgeB